MERQMEGDGMCGAIHDVVDSRSIAVVDVRTAAESLPLPLETVTLDRDDVR